MLFLFLPHFPHGKRTRHEPLSSPNTCNYSLTPPSLSVMKVGKVRSHNLGNASWVPPSAAPSDMTSEAGGQRRCIDALLRSEPEPPNGINYRADDDAGRRCHLADVRLPSGNGTFSEERNIPVEILRGGILPGPVAAPPPSLSVSFLRECSECSALGMRSLQSSGRKGRH